MYEARCCRRNATTSGSTQMDAFAKSRNSGDLGRPRSAGCSSTHSYSEPASRAAVRSAAVQRINSFASASSRACAGATSGNPSGCSRLRTTEGPPSAEQRDRKFLVTEIVEHGGDATTAAYSPAAQRCSRQGFACPPPLPVSTVVEDGVAVAASLRQEGGEIPSGRWQGPEQRKGTRRELEAAPKTWSRLRTSPARSVLRRQACPAVQ
eukprot:1111596-Pleurochrysis_carterae.AAC.1